MSTRWHFMSSRPNSKTANRPIGPAPTMRTSVLIGSVISYPSGIQVGVQLVFRLLRSSSNFGEVACLARATLQEKSTTARSEIVRIDSQFQIACALEHDLFQRPLFLVRHSGHACRDGVVTTRPSRSSLTLIWQDSRELGRTSKAKSSMSSSIGDGSPTFSRQASSI